MALQAGFRSYDVVSVLANTLTDIDKHGAAVLVEVTNTEASTALVYINEFAGHIKGGIPVPAGTTRQIPMTVYNLRASVPVTVVAYRM